VSKDEDYKETMKNLEKDEENLHNTLSQEEGVWYHCPRLWVSCGLRISVQESEHNSKVAGQIGEDKKKELIRRNLWWLKMNETIIQYVQSCTECQKNKAARHESYGLLRPLEPAYLPWKSIPIEFIADLSLSEGYDQVCNHQ
jgi:putative transposase